MILILFFLTWASSRPPRFIVKRRWLGGWRWRIAGTDMAGIITDYSYTIKYPQCIVSVNIDPTANNCYTVVFVGYGVESHVKITNGKINRFNIRY